MVDSAYFRQSLESDRWRLCQLEADDFDQLYAVAGDPELWAQHPAKDRWKRQVFQQFFAAGLENPEGIYGFYNKNTGQLAGSSRYYSLDLTGKSVKIGFTFLAKAYWGTQANRQIKDLMLNHAFKVLDHVYFDIGHQNYRSQKAAEKLGAQQVKLQDTMNFLYCLDKDTYQHLDASHD